MTTKIVQVGAGAIGSPQLLFGRNFDVEWTLIDFDKVEQKNTMSQMHPRMVVRKNKAQAMAQTMNGLFGMKVKAIPHKLTADNVEQLLGGADLVLDMLDNAPSRTIVQKYCRANGIECLHGALAGEGSFGRVVWDSDFNVDDEGRPGAATCEDGEQLPFISLVSAYIAVALQEYLKTGRKVNYNVTPEGIHIF